MRSRGYSLVEFLVAVAIIGLFSAMSLTTLPKLVPRLRLRAGLMELMTDLHSARTESLICNCNVALHFTMEHGEWGYAIYRDGNRNGVRNHEIASGVDPMVRPWKPLSDGVHIAMPSVVVHDPVESRNLQLSAAPVRWNGTHLCSFGSGYYATPGSAIVTTGGELGAVVVNDDAQIRMMYYDPAKGWSRRLF